MAHPAILFTVACMSCAIGTGAAWAVGSTEVALLSFGVQWIVFLAHAWPNRSERFYDFTGSLTFLCCILYSLHLSPHMNAKSLVCSLLVALWTIRLGTFLFARIMKAGHDSRFKRIRTSFAYFFMAWTIQGQWVLFSLLPLLALHRNPTEWCRRDGIGLGLWVTGFALEAIADAQKSAFRSDPANQEAFIRTGLWSWSRHPNYLGEILLWAGMCLSCSSSFRGSSWIAVTGPCYTAFLLLKVSGVPALEKKADKKWGHLKAYQEYKRQTRLI